MYFKSYGIIFAVFVLSSIKDQVEGSIWRSATDERLCSLPKCAGRTSAFLEQHCNKTNGLSIQNRCCFNSSINVTVGLDLGNCSLTSMVSLDSIPDIRWLNLVENSFKEAECNSSTFFGDAFEGLTKLEKVYIGNGCVCPGGKLLWNNTVPMSNNTQLCEEQLNTCKYLNETCPENAFCSSNGPGFYQCTCKKGWLGYRCLVKNGIPLTLLLGCIAGGMVLITLVLFLLQMRRKRMHSHGYYWIDGTAHRGSPRS